MVPIRRMDRASRRKGRVSDFCNFRNIFKSKLVLFYIEKRSRRKDENGNAGHTDPILQPDDESGRWSPSGKLRSTASHAPIQQPPISKPIEVPAVTNRTASPVVFRSLDRMTDILTPHQIAQLRAIGVVHDHQIDQLTVAQMNEIGVGIGQIHQIQLSAMNAKRVVQEEMAVAPPLVASVNVVPPIEVAASYKLNG